MSLKPCDPGGGGGGDTFWEFDGATLELVASALVGISGGGLQIGPNVAELEDINIEPGGNGTFIEVFSNGGSSNFIELAAQGTVAGTFININSDGDINSSIGRDWNVQAARDININSGGDIDIAADGSAVFAGTDVAIVAADLGVQVNTSNGNIALNAQAGAGVILLEGKLAPTSTIAATTPGAVISKLPVHDGSGAVLGYIPIYLTIT